MLRYVARVSYGAGYKAKVAKKLSIDSTNQHVDNKNNFWGKNNSDESKNVLKCFLYTNYYLKKTYYRQPQRHFFTTKYY